MKGHRWSHNESEEEWIQITNVSGQAIDLSDYKIGDAETKGETSGSEGMQQFPSGSIADRSSVVIANEADDFFALYGANPDYELNDTGGTPNMSDYAPWSTGGVVLANTGDEFLFFQRA